MGLFDRLFGSDSNSVYFDADALNKIYQQDNITKSFSAGKSSQRIDNAYIQIDSESAGSDKEKRNKIDQDYFLRKKQHLRDYSTDLLVQAIIRTRTNQILQYAIPVNRSNDGNGYMVVKKGKSYSEMTEDEKEMARKLEDQLYNTGKEEMDWRDDFPTFLTKVLYDFYVYDQINIERVFESARSKKLNHFNHVDAGTILIDKYPKSIDKPRSYVQVINEKEVAKFNAKNLVFLTYWNQSNVVSGGYGYSPVEAAEAQIAYHRNVEQFNARFFSQGGMTRGLLLIDPGDGGATSHFSLDSLRRNLMPGQGINGSWKIPIIQAHDAKYVNMVQSSKDMEFVNFLNYLNNIICAAFSIQPDEVNFPNRGGANGRGQNSVLNEGNTTKTKMSASKENGLAPVMKFIERIITDKILAYMDSDYHFVFTPSQEGERQRLAEEIHARMLAGETINEARAELSLPPIKDGDIPGDSNNYIQYLSIKSKLEDPEANKRQQQTSLSNPNKDKPGADVEETTTSDDTKNNEETEM